MFEKAIYNQLCKHFEVNKLFSKCQFGFRRGKNTTDALLNFVNSVYSANNNESIVSIQIDFSKAFDLVDHELLLKKLKCYGVNGAAFSLLKSYLKGRKHLTEVKYRELVIQSTILECLLGVPQGSILGPLLFIIFINDLPATLKKLGYDINVVIYADDTNIIIKAKNILDVIYIVLKVLFKWCEANKIAINFLKTCILNFTPHVLFFDHVRFNDIMINVISSNPYLGLTVDDKLHWNENIFTYGKKLNQQIYAMRKLSKIVDQKTVLIFYYANFQSKLSYGITVWGNSPRTADLLITQKRALRVLTNKPYKYPCRTLFQQLQVLTVFNLYILELLTAEIKNGNISLEGLKPKHSYNTRHAFHEKESDACLFKVKSPKSVAVKIFNNLSASLIQTFKNEGIVQFRRKLKDKLLKKPYYSLNEFFSDPI